MDELRAVQRFATGGLVPDLTVLLDLPVEAGLARKSAEVTRFEAYHDLAYHERVRAAFLGFAADEPERYAIVDAAQPAAAVLAAAIEAVRRLADPAARAWRRSVNRSGPRHACHDERRSPRTGGRAWARAGPDRRGAPGRVGRRSPRGARRAVRAIQDDGLRNRPPHHRRRRPRRGRRPGGVPRGVARRRPVRAGRGSVRTWLLSIVHHRAIDAVRRRRPTSELPARSEGQADARRR